MCFLFLYKKKIINKKNRALHHIPTAKTSQEAAAIGDDQTYIISIKGSPPVLILHYLGYRFNQRLRYEKTKNTKFGMRPMKSFIPVRQGKEFFFICFQNGSLNGDDGDADDANE